MLDPALLGEGEGEGRFQTANIKAEERKTYCGICILELNTWELIQREGTDVNMHTHTHTYFHVTP